MKDVCINLFIYLFIRSIRRLSESGLTHVLQPRAYTSETEADASDEYNLITFPMLSCGRWSSVGRSADFPACSWFDLRWLVGSLIENHRQNGSQVGSAHSRG